MKVFLLAKIVHIGLLVEFFILEKPPHLQRYEGISISVPWYCNHLNRMRSIEDYQKLKRKRLLLLLVVRILEDIAQNGWMQTFSRTQE